MPRSMTGFGRATREGADWQMTVEVKSVNHRFLKTQFRLPSILDAVEPDLEAKIRSRLSRGALTIAVDVKHRDAGVPQQLDPAFTRAQLERVKALWASVFPDAPHPEPARLFELLFRIPQPPAADGAALGAELGLAATAALDAALDALEKNRLAEGAECGRELAARKARVAALRDGIAAKAPEGIKAAQARFVERVNLILDAARPGLVIDQEAVLRESALYADKADISEELARLEGHLGRFDEVLSATSEAGRRLDFLLQEMLREANTIGSKSQDLAISHDVVEVKAEIEKMKEQVQNLE